MNQADEYRVRAIAEEIAEKEIHKTFAKMELSGPNGEPDYTTIVGWVRWWKSCPVWRAWAFRTSVTVILGALALAFLQALPSMLASFSARLWP